MLSIYFYDKILSASQDRRKVEIADQGPESVPIGRNPSNRVVLPSPCVADVAVVLKRQDTGWVLTPQEGVGNCTIGNLKASPGCTYKVTNHQSIEIFPFVLSFHYHEDREASQEQRRQALEDKAMAVIQKIHVELIHRINFEFDELKPEDINDALMVIETNLVEVAEKQGNLDAQMVNYFAAHCLRGELLNDLIAVSGDPEGDIWHGNTSWRRLISTIPERELVLKEIKERLLKSIDIGPAVQFDDQVDRVETEFWMIWEAYSGRLHDGFKRYLALRHLKKEIKDIIFGYGPLEDLLQTPNITEIMVVNRDHIYVERKGIVENSGRRFISDHVTESIIERMVNNVGGRIDRSKPLADARLRDGSRVNAVIAPLAVSGPCLTIRKFTTRKLTVRDLIDIGSLTAAAANFLEAAVHLKRNIVISGGTGSGKTTLLNCLSGFIPDKERIVTVEDTAELMLKKEHVVRLETKSENIEGKGAYTIRDLVKNALRMRPDRIVIGECRGPEALDMLQAMNTGHDGSLTTIHANSAAAVIARLEVLVQMAADLPVSSIHQQIASAIDLIVQIRRFPDGSRRVEQVTECIGIDPYFGGIKLKDIFRIDDAELTLHPTGCLPSFMGELIEGGLLDLETFYRASPALAGGADGTP
jgi:pilus assembly protein CpaF